MSTNPYQPPNADINRPDRAPGSLAKAVLTGIGIDIGGTIVISLLGSMVYAAMLAGDGTSALDIQAALGELDIFSGFGLALSMMGLAMSYIGGYWCARVANRTTYLAPTMMAIVSFSFSVMFGGGKPTWLVSLLLTAVSIGAIYFGASRVVAQIRTRDEKS